MSRSWSIPSLYRSVGIKATMNRSESSFISTLSFSLFPVSNNKKLLDLSTLLNRPKLSMRDNILVQLLALSAASIPFVSGNPVRRADCQQEYRQHEDIVEDIYIVRFKESYSLQQHFDFVGEEFDVTELEAGYHARLTKELVDKVQSDCSVQFIEDDTFGPSDDDGGDNSDDDELLVRRGEQKDAPWPLYRMSAKDKLPAEPEDETYYYVRVTWEDLVLALADLYLSFGTDR